MKQFRLALYLLSCLLLVSACSGPKTAAKKADEDRATALQYFNEIQVYQDTFNTLLLDGNVNISSSAFNGSGKFKVRMLKDSIIWARISKFGFEIARLSIKPDSIIYINRLENSYLHVPTEEFIYKTLGFAADFNSLQRILLGEEPFPYNAIPPITLRNDSLNINARPQNISGAMRIQYIDPFVKPAYIYGVTERGETIKLQNTAFINIDKVRSFPLQRQYDFKNREIVFSIQLRVENYAINQITTFPVSIPGHYSVLYW